MSSDLPLSVLILWHQHQPFYKDLLSNRYELPWVRLHATKDYLDMVSLLDEFPGMKLNFNLVPSLLVQLDDYAQGKAQDRFLEVSRANAADLSFEDKRFILQNFFMANWDRMIEAYPRYRELLEKRGRAAGPNEFSRTQNYFKEQDWRDLQVWFNLTWFDPLWREKDPFIAALHAKGKQYSEEEKQQLLDKQNIICGQVAAKHKELQDRGQVEITATPFYHPILPLLCDTDAARMAMSAAHLPRPFVHPEDAKEQIERALRDHEARFGRRPAGMWPSEGSVSEATANLFMDAGVRWVATDEAILAHSRELEKAAFAREDIYEPHQFLCNGRPLSFFFRDHELSDAIGFVYTQWNSHDAVENFIGRLRSIHDRLKAQDGGQPRPHVVPVILDGENCWEYYQQDGLPFLRELYGRLSSESWLQTVRGSDYLNDNGPGKPLGKLWSGSWINANFAIWIGHSEDNTAWEFLQRTRDFLKSHLDKHPDLQTTPAAKLAWEEILIAEGSDWCWWYGDDHSSGNDEMFDYLFRKHLMNVYSLLGVKVPEDLHAAIKQTRGKTGVKAPVDFITPTLDGRVTSYFEWQGAGIYNTDGGASGAMHRTTNLIKTIHFGFDLQNLYFRIDFLPTRSPETAPLTVKLSFLKPEGYELQIDLQTGTPPMARLKYPNASQPTAEIGKLAYGKILEFALPLALLPKEGFPIQANIHLEKAGTETERWPADSPITIPFPTADSFAESWVV